MFDVLVKLHDWRNFEKRHEEHCDGINGWPTRIEMPKECENLLYFENYNNQHKVPYVIYAYFEAIVQKMQWYERNKQGSHTENKSHCMWLCLQSSKKWWNCIRYKILQRRKCCVKFLKAILLEEEKIRKDLENSQPILKQEQDWVNFRETTHCHISGKALVKESILDSLPVYDRDKGSYCGQAHTKCLYKEIFIGSRKRPQPLDKVDEWIKNSQEDCLYCLEPLLVRNYRDAVKDHCHKTGKYREAAHNVCNLNLRIKLKTHLIPVVFHSLEGYDAHHLFQVILKIKDKKISCIPNNVEKDLSFHCVGCVL